MLTEREECWAGVGGRLAGLLPLPQDEEEEEVVGRSEEEVQD